MAGQLKKCKKMRSWHLASGFIDGTPDPLATEEKVKKKTDLSRSIKTRRPPQVFERIQINCKKNDYSGYEGVNVR